MKVHDGLLGDSLREALEQVGADAWLIYDFHGLNPVARRLLGLEGMATRRLFALFPSEGNPVAIVHRIETHLYEDFPGETVLYSSWQELRNAIKSVVSGRKLAMEVSHGDRVPYLDRVPFGVVEMITECGAEVLESSDLVTRFSAVWSPQELDEHREAAESIAEIARTQLARLVGGELGEISEVSFQNTILTEFDRLGLHTIDPPIVAFGENSANPHHEPGLGGERVIRADEVVLLDLWAGVREGAVFADQTWMAFNGRVPGERVISVWQAVRGARDAVLDRVRSSGTDQTGADLDRVARQYISDAGFGDFFTHRTGHSIDGDLHGSGPHLDSYETEDSRQLCEGIGFSVEPGVYLPGDFGVRSEVNVYLGGRGVEVTPTRLQSELILAV